ncbi:unnamed protein product, partial [Mesorhabditis spiculigera]
MAAELRVAAMGINYIKTIRVVFLFFAFRLGALTLETLFLAQSLTKRQPPGPPMERMRTLERVVETRIDLLEFEKADEVREDCACCRSLDCDIIFALLFTLVIACLLVLIMVFWLKGVLAYEESRGLDMAAVFCYCIKLTVGVVDCDDQVDWIHNASRGEFSFPRLPKIPTQHLDATRAPIKNLQCVYTFIAGPGKRVRLEFDQFQLAGSADNCELEYVDIYSELEKAEPDLLSATLSGRYCGSVSPYVRISLHDVLVLVFHSRAGDTLGRDFRFRGRYSFIDDKKFTPGEPVTGYKCHYLIEPSRYSSQKKSHHILSPTYPGAYPRNFHCAYHLKGRPGERVRLFFQDFDLCFGGEHCPYDTVTIYDGPTSASPIIRKMCGLQLREEVFSVGSDLLIHFNTSGSSKGDPRGFFLEYEISSKFVDVEQLLGGEKGVTHVRGSECDVRVESNKETTHHIHSPQYPHKYPANSTCTYILDGLQGEQNLEKVLLTFDTLAVISDAPDGHHHHHGSHGNEEVTCPNAWVGVAITEGNIKATLSSKDESNFDATLCDRISKGSAAMGPYESEGARMVVQFGTSNHTSTDGQHPLGFKATIQFKTDFGVPGDPMGDSNECLFRFTQPNGFFNSPRYPANYPLDTNCTYLIEGRPGDVVLIYFEHFALFSENAGDRCKDWIEIYDVFREADGSERLSVPVSYCAGTFPGPRRSAEGSHEMRILFSSDSNGSNNGFKALYEIRKRVPSAPSKQDDMAGCGPLKIEASAENPSGYIRSPGFGAKYQENVFCDWSITARPGNRLLLHLVAMQVEGAMGDVDTPSCPKAVIRVSTVDQKYEFCGTVATVIPPIITSNNTVRITFLTAPDKVNGLSGFNFTWTEVRPAEEETCSGDDVYLCTYSKLCISSRLRCDDDLNCRTATEHDDSDESHCVLKESSADRTLVLAMVVCGGIFAFILIFFCYLFKSKLTRRKKGNGVPPAARLRPRHPAGRPKIQRQPHSHESGLGVSAASRFAHHDATGLLPSLATPFDSITNRILLPEPDTDGIQTFYG